MNKTAIRIIAGAKRLTVFFCIFFVVISSASAKQSWRGLVVEPEDRCSPYNKKAQYPYSQTVEDEVVQNMGGNIYGPYTGRYFVSDTETDIEHIVAASEGHDSGLCSASAEKRAQFASDPLNLTLAAPEINRCGANGKCGLDAAEWMPERNKCWFANRIVEIKVKYNLSVNRSEAEALEKVLDSCKSFEMIFFPRSDHREIEASITNQGSVLAMYDDNDNGRITCAEARAHGLASVTREHPAYKFMNDRDGDGVVCE
ncbi:excalibur calcium-binding domain-containing protein [Microbulbifer sp. VAAF005]|uniref:excalibur calcium-binding domain-containing protein n=1 Tax=Microbulbifer sp. VAAF005 TaxID=3034230 RepID=UPI0024ACB83C|nr:excalibur calcium-binding domain-containing protein [Microbulbifer sp. VAAF005]WHI48960.1 excalibur calcium-binding domain-containing protein [Microbulbifer sp. VAAF005]